MKKKKSGSDSSHKEWPALPSSQSSIGTGVQVSHVEELKTDAPQDKTHQPSIPSPSQSSYLAAAQHNPAHGPNKFFKPSSDGFNTMLSKTDLRAARQAQFPRERNGAHSRTFTLKGAPKVVSCELYLENVNIPSGASNKDIGASITAHANQHDIRIMKCFVRQNRFVADQVGCKITVPTTQSQQCKATGIWPPHVTCREWVPRSEMQERASHPNSWRPPHRRPRPYNRQHRYKYSDTQEYVGDYEDDYDHDYKDGYTSNAEEKEWWEPRASTEWD